MRPQTQEPSEGPPRIALLRPHLFRAPGTYPWTPHSPLPSSQQSPLARALPQVSFQGDMGTIAGSPCLASGTSTSTSSRSCWFCAACVETRSPMPCRTLWPPTWSHASLSPRQVPPAKPHLGCQGPGCTWTDHCSLGRARTPSPTPPKALGGSRPQQEAPPGPLWEPQDCCPLPGSLCLLSPSISPCPADSQPVSSVQRLQLHHTPHLCAVAWH